MRLKTFALCFNNNSVHTNTWKYEESLYSRCFPQEFASLFLRGQKKLRWSLTYTNLKMSLTVLTYIQPRAGCMCISSCASSMSRLLYWRFACFLLGSKACPRKIMASQAKWSVYNSFQDDELEALRQAALATLKKVMFDFYICTFLSPRL